MDVRDFDFDLPAGLIAQEPAADRGSSRLLHLDRATGAIAHSRFASLPDLLAAGDLVVVNDTRVFPARLLGRRVPSGGAVECLLLRRCDDEHWEALVHPGQKLKPGAQLAFERGRLAQLERRDSGAAVPRAPSIRLWTRQRGLRGRRRSTRSATCRCRRTSSAPIATRIASATRRSSRERRGSIAAPTAGLHFTPESVRAALRARGVELAAITLHVGYGTFQPVRADRVEEHRSSRSGTTSDAAAAQAVNAALDEGAACRRRRHDHHADARGGGRRQRRPRWSPASVRPACSSIRVFVSR